MSSGTDRRFGVGSFDGEGDHEADSRPVAPELDNTASMAIEMQPIGVVRNERTDAIDDDWDRVPSTIELDPSVVGADAAAGLDAFSHVEVVFVFDRVDPERVERGSRHPRGNAEWPVVGILAQRAKARPNRIGSTVCELVAVRPGGVLEVRGLDAIDGTPVLDIKPYMVEFGPRGEVRQPSWSTELMAGYWVVDADEA